METATMLKSKRQQQNKPAKKRARRRALPLPNAIAWTIADYQALGGPGKTSIYQLAEQGKLKLFKDECGRTMIEGNSGRALLGIMDEGAA
jgi:hypothetical protein